MFSPKHPSAGDGLLNPARKRTRQTTSRPASRTTNRHERSESSQSNTRSQEVSAAPTRQSSLVPGTQDFAFSRRGASTHPHKEHNNGEVDWTKNDKYRVSKLLALPPIFNSCTVNNLPVTAATESIHSYALMLSHSSAYCWRYTTPHALPHTYSFPLPQDEGQHQTSLPFPLGAIVSPSANSKEPGLVVVMPMTGRVAYWDSIGSAVAEGLFIKKRGVEGQVPIFSGESVTAICSAEPAGFILSLSSGRLAHLALRDVAGRPGVTVTIMRGNGTGMMSGFLGALRAGSSRRDVVAVRAGKQLGVGEREIIVGTARANFSRWHVKRSGVYENIADLDLRDDILTSIEDTGKAHGRSRDQFVVLDLDVNSSQDEDLRIAVLGAYLPDSNHSNALYTMVSIHFTAAAQAHVSSVYIINSYTDTLDSSSRVKPRLYLPKPEKTAFVVFPRAVVIISSINKTTTDEDGMEEDQPGFFEDVVDFRGDIKIEIVGSGSEDVVTSSARAANPSFQSQEQASSQSERLKNPGVVLVAKGGGIVRVEAFDVERKRGPQLPVTVKSKLEQAVFYGIKEDNPLNFKGRREIKYLVEDLEAAALEISREIIGTSNPYQPTLASSLSEHLKGRAAHLRALVEHLQTGAFGRVSKLVMWKLLSDAEKIEAARAVYNVWDKRRDEDQDAAEGLLENIIQNYLPLDPTKVTGDDPVRSWFTKEVDNIGSLLPYVKKSLVHQSNLLQQQSNGKKPHVAVATSDAEANDIIIGALMAAWKFRVRSAELYGIKNVNENGLLGDSGSFPAPWTSTPAVLQSLADQHELSITLLKSIINPKLNEDPSRLEIAEKISEQLVDLAEICCRAFEERADWCDNQPSTDDGVHLEGQTIRERYNGSRGSWIKPLVTYNRTTLAYSTAEKWLDYETLVEICSEQMLSAELILAEPAKNTAAAVTDAKAIKSETTDRLVHYFNTFGKPFAETMYTYLIKHNQLQKLLNGFELWRNQYLTPFLRSKPGYAKLSWIHDIHLNDYPRAASTLTAVSDTEENLAYKKISLSIAKLSALAHDPAASTEPLDAALSLAGFQSRVLTALQHIPNTAVDTDAAIHLGTSSLARHLRNQPYLRLQFRRHFEALITNKTLAPEDLAELLTLIQTKDPWFDNKEFFYALRIAATSALAPSLREVVEKNIWRRIYIRDDWTQLSNTRNRSDAAISDASKGTALWKTLELGYKEKLFGEQGLAYVRPPSEVRFGEGPEEIVARFPKEQRHELQDAGVDWMSENKQLDLYVKKTDLEERFRGWVVELSGKREESVEVDEGETVYEKEETVYEEEETVYEEEETVYEEGETMVYEEGETYTEEYEEGDTVMEE